jgi:hypothetical protein
VDERRPSPHGQPPLQRREGAEERDRRAQDDPRPDRPALLAALDERQDHRDQGGGDEQRAREVETIAALGPRLRDDARRQHERRRTDRDVDQVAGAPVEPHRIELDQQPSDQLAADRAEPEEQAVQGDRLLPLLALVGDPDDREHLRREQRRTDPLHDPAGDQHAGARRPAADGRRDCEQRQPDHEDPPPADQITEPATDDEAGRECDRVGDDDELDLAGARAEVALGGRDRDVDDEEVEREHERPGQ